MTTTTVSYTRIGVQAITTQPSYMVTASLFPLSFLQTHGKKEARLNRLQGQQAAYSRNIKVKQWSVMSAVLSAFFVAVS